MFNNLTIVSKFFILRMAVLSNLICCFSNATNSQQSWKPHQLKTVFYNLDLKIDFKENHLSGECGMTITSNSNKPVTNIPLLLYRLMKVTSVKDDKGNPLRFRQRILSFEDWQTYQANFIEVYLSKQLAAGNTCKLKIFYEGYLLGYTETGMGYVRDRIDPEFTIIRPDCLAYPELGFPFEKINRAAGFAPSFDYEIKINVPDSLTVVNGGQLVSKTNRNGYVAYTYKNTKLAWRIDILIGKYKTLESSQLKIHYLEQDRAGAETVLRYAQNTLALFSKWWGPLKEMKTFSVIEIPAGYGSQADVTCILQSADVFLDSTQMRQLYHELSHLWNVNSTDKYYPRWNEGLATFLEYLTIEKLENRLYLDYVTDWYLNLVKKEIQEDSLLKTTPFIDFSKNEIQSYAYEIGMLMFRILYEVMGENDFNKCLATYYTDYYSTGATTDQFVETAVNIGEYNLVEFFRDWMYTPRYTQLISDGLTIKEMSKLYIKH
jgi:hypothetical protein